MLVNSGREQLCKLNFRKVMEANLRRFIQTTSNKAHIDTIEPIVLVNFIRVREEFCDGGDLNRDSFIIDKENIDGNISPPYVR